MKYLKKTHKNKPGSTIKNIRNKKGLTQEQLAFKLEISQKSYSNIENGKTKLKNNMLMKIAKALEITPSIICPIYEQCGCDIDLQDEYIRLLEFVKSKNIPIPEEFKEITEAKKL